jgi:hypothetical protein
VWSHVDELASAAQTFEGNQTCRLVSWLCLIAVI